MVKIVLAVVALLYLVNVYGKVGDRSFALSRIAESRGVADGDNLIASTSIIAKSATKTSPIESSNPINLFISAFQKSFRQGLSGGAAGLVQVITMMWLRTTVTYQYRYGVTTAQAIAELYAQGGIGRFYRGVTYAIIQAPLCRFGSVAANEISNLLVGVGSGHDSPSSSSSSSLTKRPIINEYMKIILAATLGSALSTVWRIVLMPLDTAKTVLQVDGLPGFRTLMQQVSTGDISPLFRGTAATIIATWIGHSWFLVHNWLDHAISLPMAPRAKIARAATIGFLASAISDAITNFIKVIKTVKQAMLFDAAGKAPSYVAVVNHVVGESGYAGLFGRGLLTRMVSNGLQSMLFTVLWKVYFDEKKSKAGRSSSGRGDTITIDDS